MPSTLRVAACGLMLAILLSGCEAKEAVEAPFTKLTCYHMVHNKAGGYDFNVVAKNIPNLEYCAAALERMRLRFVSLGGTHTEITGSYQGQFIFVQREGVFSSQKFKSGAYLALIRTDDGRLVVPGAPRVP